MGSVIVQRGLTTPEDRLVDYVASLGFLMLYGPIHRDVDQIEVQPRYDELADKIRPVVRSLWARGLKGQRLRAAIPAAVMPAISQVYTARLQSGDRFVLRRIEEMH